MLPRSTASKVSLTSGMRAQVQVWYDEELAISQILELDRVDNGSEFCGGSPKKLHNWNHRLSLLGAMLKSIPPGTKHLLALVENAHRADDEYVLMIHAGRSLHALSVFPNAISFLY
jgi:hypothetical protein